MPEEINTLLTKLNNVEIFEKGMRKYYTGTLFDKNVVIAFSRWGKVASAITATQIINDFNPSEIIFTGVAGGVDEGLEIGDVVIGKNLYQYDVDARPFFEKFEIPMLNLKSFNTKNSGKLIEATNEFFKNYKKYINPEQAEQFNIKSPKTILGDIGSGDKFVSNEKIITQLKKDIPSITCVEMEGASVAQVCYEYDIPFSIIRTISDKANDNSHIDFPEFARTIASNYALGILKYYFL